MSESISGEAMRAAILIVVAESPAADESPDHGLRRVHALGQLLVGETGTGARLDHRRCQREVVLKSIVNLLSYSGSPRQAAKDSSTRRDRGKRRAGSAVRCKPEMASRPRAEIHNEFFPDRVFLRWQVQRPALRVEKGTPCAFGSRAEEGVSAEAGLVFDGCLLDGSVPIDEDSYLDDEILCVTGARRHVPTSRDLLSDDVVNFGRRGPAT